MFDFVFRFFFGGIKCDKCYRNAKFSVVYTLNNKDESVGKIFHVNGNKVSRETELCSNHKDSLLDKEYTWPTLVGYKVTGH